MSKAFDKLTVDKIPLSLQVLRAVRRAILVGRYRSGERLHEEDMSRELAVSRHAVRIALSTLEAEGLVEGDPYRGKIVAELYPSQLAYLLPARVLLECRAAEKAILNLADDDSRRLRRMAPRLKDPDVDWEEHVELDLEFHQLLWTLAADVRLEKLLRQVVYPFFAIRYRSADQLGDWIQQEQEEKPSGHQPLIEAICQRDAARAKKLMELHVGSANLDDKQPRGEVEPEVVAG